MSSANVTLDGFDGGARMSRTDAAMTGQVPRAADRRAANSSRRLRRPKGKSSVIRVSGWLLARTRSSVSMRSCRKVADATDPSEVSRRVKSTPSDRSGGSCTISTPVKSRWTTGMPPLTSVTECPASTHARARFSARTRWPVPSRCVTTIITRMAMPPPAVLRTQGPNRHPQCAGQRGGCA